jgi:hypothetical protein
MLEEELDDSIAEVPILDEIEEDFELDEILSSLVIDLSDLE